MTGCGGETFWQRWPSENNNILKLFNRLDVTCLPFSLSTACRYLTIYVTEGCRPQNRLYYLDLDVVPKHPDTNTLDFSTFDFLKGQHTGALGTKQLLHISLVTCLLDLHMPSEHAGILQHPAWLAPPCQVEAKPCPYMHRGLWSPSKCSSRHPGVYVDVKRAECVLACVLDVPARCQAPPCGEAG
jgi:hypothetical protein